MTDGTDARATTSQSSGVDRLKHSADVAAAALAMVAAAGLAALMPEGSLLRLALIAPILLIAPGYLLIQALVVPARSARTRLLHGFLSFGVSPAVLGLLALATALLPNGFQPWIIVASVTLGCVLLAGIAVRRRWARARVVHSEEDVTQTA